MRACGWCFLFFVFTEILGQGSWKEVQEVADEKGLSLLCNRAKELVMKTHASATVKAYESAFGRWSIWAAEPDFEALPATPVAISLYLLELMEASSSSSTITKAVAAIKWAHEKACLSSPLDAMVKQIVTAAKRELARPPVRKQPLSKEMVAQVVGKLTESDNCMDLRSAVMFALGFAGFMRWDDMQRVCVGDISFRKDHMEVRLAKRKNDQLRQGSTILIGRQPGDQGAMALCQKLISLAHLQEDDHILSNLVKTKEGWKTRKGSLKYGRARELFREALLRAGLEAEKFGLHSLRSGGTTAAAAANVPQRLLKRHGGWRSEAVNAYIQETLDNMLEPSAAASW